MWEMQVDDTVEITATRVLPEKPIDIFMVGGYNNKTYMFKKK